MRKFGTGAAQTIWGWWNDFWEKNVRDKGFLGILAGIIPFVIAIVGVVITGIIDAIVEFFEWVGGWFNAEDDDRARDTINNGSCAQLNALSDDTLVEMINSMISGPTGDDDENAINKIMQCADCSKIQAVLSMNGTRWDDFDGAIHGSEWTAFRNILNSRCGITG